MIAAPHSTPEGGLLAAEVEAKLSEFTGDQTEWVSWREKRIIIVQVVACQMRLSVLFGVCEPEKKMFGSISMVAIAVPSERE